MAIINTYDQLKQAVEQGIIEKGIAVAISRNASVHKWTGSYWDVWSPFFNTDPNAHWSYYKKKAFTYSTRADSKQAFEEAKRFALDNYGIEKFVRNRTGDYVPEIVNKRLPIPKREEKPAPES